MVIALIIVILAFLVLGGWAGLGKILSSKFFGYCFFVFVIWLMIQWLIVDNLPHN